MSSFYHGAAAGILSVALLQGGISPVSHTLLFLGVIAVHSVLGALYGIERWKEGYKVGFEDSQARGWDEARRKWRDKVETK